MNRHLSSNEKNRSIHNADMMKDMLLSWILCCFLLRGTLHGQLLSRRQGPADYAFSQR